MRVCVAAMKILVILAAIAAWTSSSALAALILPPVPVAPVITWTGFYVGGTGSRDRTRFEGLQTLPIRPPTCPTRRATRFRTLHSWAVSRPATIGNLRRHGSPALKPTGIGRTPVTTSAVKPVLIALHAATTASDSKRSTAKLTGWRHFAASRRDVGKLAVLWDWRRSLGADQHDPDSELLAGRLRRYRRWRWRFILPLFASSSTSTTAAGWVAGLGAEWMFAGNWSVRAEWLHIDLGSINDLLPTVGTGGTIQTAVWSRTERFDEFRAGVNYLFRP